MELRLLKPILLSAVLFSGLQAHGQTIRTVAGIHDSTGYIGDGGRAIRAQIGMPLGVATDKAGNLYLSDSYNNLVRKVAVNGIISTVAGTGARGYNGDSIAATSAKLNSPTGVAADEAGNIYIVDNGNFRIRMVDTAGIIYTVAGIGGIHGFGDSGDSGAATAAHIYVSGVAVDRFQNIYIADGNTSVRKVTHTTGIISTVAGSHAYGYTGDGGSAVSASMNNPTNVAVDTAGNLYIADMGNNVIRKVSRASGNITTIAGTGTAGFSGDGDTATLARISQPYGVAVDTSGNLYIGDQGNNRIRKVNLATNIITTVAGNGTSAYSGDGGPAVSASLAGAAALCATPYGSLFLADQNTSGPGASSVIREVSNTAVADITASPLVSCTGAPVRFSAAVANPVLGESFQWKYNGADVGADTNTYSSATIVTGDHISCVISFPSADSVIAFSDTVTTAVDTYVIPSVTITPIHAIVITADPITFTATVINGGLAPDFQWYVNGVVVPGATSSVFTDSFTTLPDSVSCRVISSALCLLSPTAQSNIAVIEPEGVAQLSLSDEIMLLPNPNKGTFFLKTATGSPLSETADLQITDVLGHIVYHDGQIRLQSGTSTPVALSGGLPPGAYLLHIRSASASKVLPFIIEK